MIFAVCSALLYVFALTVPGVEKEFRVSFALVVAASIFCAFVYGVLIS